MAARPRTLRHRWSEARDEPHVTLQYQCLPQHVNTALHPFIQQLRYAARIFDNDGADIQLEKAETTTILHLTVRAANSHRAKQARYSDCPFRVMSTRSQLYQRKIRFGSWLSLRERCRTSTL